MLKLEKLNNNLASGLATALQSHQEFLLPQQAFLAAVWVSIVFIDLVVVMIYQYFLLILYSTQYW